jgi:hypothetical protein
MRSFLSSFFVLSLTAITAGCGSSSDSPASATGTGGAGGIGGAAGIGGGATAGSGGTDAAGMGGSDGLGGSDAGGMGGAAGTGGTTGMAGKAGAAGMGGAPPGTPVYPTLQSFGQPILTTVSLVTVTFKGWTGEASAQAYDDAILKSAWLQAVAGEYGFTGGTHVGSFSLDETAPTTIDDGEMAGFIGKHIAAGTLPAAPAGVTDYVYMLYFPSNTSITEGGGKSCKDFGGYHSAGPVPGMPGVAVTYAVIPDCKSALETQYAASHELIETITDPTQKGWHMFSCPWTEAMGYASNSLVEVGDLCGSLGWKEGAYNYQRSWSKAAATAGKEPCVPTAGVSFGVVPAKALLNVKTGQTPTTTLLTGWSDAPIDNWSIGFQGQGVSVKFSTKLINDQLTSMISVTAPTGTPPGQYYGFLTSTYMGETHLYPIGFNVLLVAWLSFVRMSSRPD